MKRQLDDAQRRCVVKTAEATSLRAQTMRLAVDCGKLQLRLRGITPATSGASTVASTVATSSTTSATAAVPLLV